MALLGARNFDGLTVDPRVACARRIRYTDARQQATCGEGQSELNYWLCSAEESKTSCTTDGGKAAGPRVR